MARRTTDFWHSIRRPTASAVLLQDERKGKKTWAGPKALSDLTSVPYCAFFDLFWPQPYPHPSRSKPPLQPGRCSAGVGCRCQVAAAAEAQVVAAGHRSVFSRGALMLLILDVLVRLGSTEASWLVDGCSRLDSKG